jgi:hypothetical protein
MGGDRAANLFEEGGIGRVTARGSQAPSEPQPFRVRVLAPARRRAKPSQLCWIALLLSSCASPPPEPVLWAWERPEDLRFLAPGEAAVAVLIGTIRLEGDAVRTHPRSAPLKVEQETVVGAVVRIEARPDATLDAKQRRLTADWIVELADRPAFAELQIDFDAAESQREFYRLLLEDLRPRFPRLGVTALASWCFESGRWLASLPVDEITPMLFRMGPGAGPYLVQLEREGEFPNPLCGASVGVSTDEPLRWRPRAPKLYVFHPRSWTAADWRAFASSLR